MKRGFLFALGLTAIAFASIGHALFAAAAPAIALVREVWAVAFPAANAREALPSLISTETIRQGVSRAQTDSFVARRANRSAVGRGSGDRCLGLAIAA